MAAERGVGLFAGNDQEIAIGEAGAAFEVDALLIEPDLAGIGGMRIGMEIAQRGDIDAQRFEGGDPLRLVIDGPGVGQLLVEMEVEVADHHLVAGQGFVDIVVREGHHRLLGGLARCPNPDRSRRPSAAWCPAERCRARSSPRTRAPG